ACAESRGGCACRSERRRSGLPPESRSGSPEASASFPPCGPPWPTLPRGLTNGLALARRARVAPLQRQRLFQLPVTERLTDPPHSSLKDVPVKEKIWRIFEIVFPTMLSLFPRIPQNPSITEPAGQSPT